MKLLLNGCTGFIGKELIKKLKAEDYSLIVLSRNPDKNKPLEDKNIEVLYWDSLNPLPISLLEESNAVINLAGEPIVNKRWSNHQKKLLKESRINTTKNLVKAISMSSKKPAVLINASAVGYYGNIEDEIVTETSKKGIGFLANLCEQWEKEALQAESFGVRVVILRTGIVLEKGGGALSKMLLPFKLFTGGPLGSGKQWFPWIHRDDVINIILYSLQNKDTTGPLNVTAPNPVTMNNFCKTLGHVLSRPSWMPVPALALKLLLGEMSELLLNGQNVIPERALQLGYKFKYPLLEDTLRKML